jgi:hypothetical protein
VEGDMSTSKVFKVFEKEVIPKDSEYKWAERKIRELRPSWKDFTDERVAVSQYHLNQAKKYLERKHFCILVGYKDIGKTWLSYALGYNLVKQGKRVRFATIDKNFDGEDAWNEIESQELKGKNKPEVYFIIEDCHTNSEESEEFFQKILDNSEENLRFLFTMRKTGKVLLEDMEPEDTFYNEGITRGCIVRLLPDKLIKEHVKNIIKKFIEVEGIKYEVSEKELEDVSKGWGDDLYWLWLRLNSWKYTEGQKLSDITDDQVYESIWSDRYEIKLSMMSRRNILLVIAAICQFEPLKVTDSFLRGRNIDEETLKELKVEGIIRTSKEYELLSIPEGFADIILSCVLKKDPSFKKNYNIKEDYTVQIIKDYLIQNPPIWTNVFSALYSARETEKASSAKQILSSLQDDAHIWEIVKENVEYMSWGHMNSLLDSLLWIEEKNSWMESKKASEIRSRYFKHNYKNIQSKLKLSSAKTIKRYLPLLGHTVNLNKFFDGFLTSDYKHIINLSTIPTIRKLLFSFQEQNWNIPYVAEKMVETLPDADLTRLIAQENTTLYRLGGLIGNVMQVDPSSAERFVKELSEIDLSELFSREDPIAEEKGFTNAWSICYFLSHWISFTPNYRNRIVSNISDELWHHLIIQASSDDGFWLLWNIYVNDLNKAKRIVQNEIGEFLLQKCTKDQNTVFCLPLLGVLQICDFTIHNIPLIETDITKIEKILRTFKRERKITLLVLSLVALKVKMPREQFEDVKKIIDGQLIDFIQNGSDIQVRGILINLIEYYCN